MSDKNLVPMRSKSFEDLKNVNEYGAEYWSAREAGVYDRMFGVFHDSGYKGCKEVLAGTQ